MSEKSEKSEQNRLSVFKTYKLYVGASSPAARAAGCTK